MHRLICLLSLLTVSLYAVDASALADPTLVVETAARLDSRKLDTSRTFVADGQQLSRDGIDAVFTEGRFFPVIRSDDRVIGLLFDGEGTLEVIIPDGVETLSWQSATSYSALSQSFTSAYLRFSDGTLDDLQGERAWTDDKDPSGANFRTFESRTGMLDDPQWTRWAPNLTIDQLMDLYGGGHVGGHLLAEFRMSGDGRADWLSYLQNPRGALIPGETHALYTVRPLGGAPPELNVIASWGASSESGPAFDVAYTGIDIKFPTGSKGNRNMVDGVVSAQLDLIATRPDLPLKAIVLELEHERRLCTAQSDRDFISIKRVTDGDGNGLAANHRGNRLLVALAKPVQPGQQATLNIDYAGPMTQGIPVKGRPDTFFSPLGPWAWYPRSVHLDRFASRVEAHMPRYIRAVAPGDMTEERKEKDGWHFVFEEPSGVRTLTLAVGDMIVTPASDHGANPKIMVWYGQGQEKDLKSATAPVRQMVDFIGSIWGGYPYSTLHVVESMPYPAANWSMTGDSRSGSWSCVPPSQTHPWQGFVEGSSGMILSAFPTTAPARDLPQARVLDRMFTDPVEVATFLRFTDIARQWWGHLVPPASPRDVWIPEAMVHWTGLLFTRAGIGEGAMKERIKTMRASMVENHDISQPLVTGERLGRGFAPQVWGRGPLVVAWLVERMDARIFMTAMNTLVNRASSQGVSAELLIETVAAMGDSGLAEQLRFYVEDNRLPDVDYTSSIDKDSGEVLIVFKQEADAFLPTDVTFELVFSPKEKQKRIVSLTQPITAWRLTLDKAPKRVVIDPLGAGLVRSLRKVQGLEAPPEAALTEAPPTDTPPTDVPEPAPADAPPVVAPADAPADEAPAGEASGDEAPDDPTPAEETP